MARLKKIINNDIFKTVLVYSFLFAILIFFMGSIFNAYGKEFVWNDPDGITQHFINLRYFRDLIINFIRTGSLSTFTWNIGIGIDLFSNLNYYITGDIFSYLSILVPTKNVESLYSILIIIRMYFVGISFIAYCKYKKMNNYSTIIGSLMYTFSSFILFSAVRHPYFTNAVILFPLLMIGIEKIIVENKKIFYILIIALMFVVSFYFGYMMALIIAIYGVFLAINTYKKEGIKKIIKVLLKVLFCSLVGVLISGVILIPTLIDFLNSERASFVVHSYSVNYYRSLVSNLLTTSGSYWLYWGVQSIILITLPLFIKNRKENKPLFWLFILLLFPVLFSKIGSILDGFSFPNNRWAYVFAFIFSFITTEFLNNKNSINKKDLNIIIIFTSIYLIINYIFEKTLSIYTVVQMGIFLLILLTLLNKDVINSKIKIKNISNKIITIIITIGIFSSIYGIFITSDYLKEFTDVDGANALMNNSRNTINSFAKAVNYLNEVDKSYYKISRYPLDYENLGLLKNFNSITIYYSIIPSIYEEIGNDLDNVQYYINWGLKEFDYRTKITSLLGVKYQITTSDKRVPYGYSLVEEYSDGTKIYQNDYAISFAALYTDYITEDVYENLSSIEKESALLKATVLSNEVNKDNLTYVKDLDLSSIGNVDYNIIDKYEILNGNTITITDTSKNYIDLEIADIENKEVYVYLENLDYKPYSKNELIDLYTTEESTKYDIQKLKQNYKWYQPNYAYNVSIKYNGFTNSKTIKDYLTSPYYYYYDGLLFNMGYQDEASGNIRISLSLVGTYSFDSIKVYTVSMEDYEDDINNLNRANFEITSYGNGYFEGTVNTEEAGILQFSTFYNDGFTVYVDGEEVDAFVSNKYFLGINISAGYHTIYIEYHNSYIKYGLICSITGIIIFMGIFIYNIRKKKIN